MKSKTAHPEGLPPDQGSRRDGGHGRGFQRDGAAGYPFFIFAQVGPLTWPAMAKYLANAVEIPSPTTDTLCAAAKTAGIDVVIGIVS